MHQAHDLAPTLEMRALDLCQSLGHVTDGGGACHLCVNTIKREDAEEEAKRQSSTNSSRR